MGRDHYPTAGDLRSALIAAGLTVSADLEGQLLAMAPAGVTAFERQVNRKMLAGSASLRTFDPPTTSGGVKFIPDLASVAEDGVTPTTVTVTYQPSGQGAVTWAVPRDYLLEGSDYDPNPMRPWTRLRATGNSWFGVPLAPTYRQSVSITGRWGYASLIPDDAWLAMLFIAAAQALGIGLFALRGGVSKWTQQGVTEEYLPRIVEWKSAVDAAVMAYRRLDIG